MDETKAATWAVGQLRHLYKQMVAGGVRDTAEAARGLLGPAIEKLEPLTTAASSQPASEIESLKAALAVEKAAQEKAEAALRGAVAEFNLRADTNEGKAKKATPDASGIFSGASLAYEFAADYLKTLCARAALASPSESAPQPGALSSLIGQLLMIAENEAVCSNCDTSYSDTSRGCPECIGARAAITDAKRLRLNAGSNPTTPTPQPTPETRVDVFTGYDPPLVGAVAFLRSVIRSGDQLSAEDDVMLDKMVADARRAAPTGQQQEAGARAVVLATMLADVREGDREDGRTCDVGGRTHRNRYGTFGIETCPLCAPLPEYDDASGEPPARPPEPAAAPPSAPQEGLFKEGWEAGREAAAEACDLMAEETPPHSETRRITASNCAHAIRALPLPESALLTKAAPQPKDGLERWCSCSYRTHGGGSCDAHADVARSCVWCDAYLCRYCYDIHPCQAEVPYGEPPRVSREHVPPAAVPDTQSHPAAPAPVETRLNKEES